MAKAKKRVILSKKFSVLGRTEDLHLIRRLLLVRLSKLDVAATTSDLGRIPGGKPATPHLYALHNLGFVNDCTPRKVSYTAPKKEWEISEPGRQYLEEEEQ